MKKLIKIEGMSCAHCVRHVQEALKELAAVSNATVDLAGKKAVVELNGEAVNSDLKKAIEEAGYDVVSIENI